MRGGGRKTCMIEDMLFLGLDLYCTDPAQHLVPAG